MEASSLQMLNKWKPVLLYKTQQWSALPGLRDSESIMEQRVFAVSCWVSGEKWKQMRHLTQVLLELPANGENRHKPKEFHCG